MPLLYKRDLSQEATLGIWKLEETLEQLKTAYSFHKSEENKFNLATSVKRQKELYATRLLLAELMPQQIIMYDKNGGPYLSNGQFISISHTLGYIALFIDSKNKVGIDIQVPKKNIDKGIKLFMQQKEISHLNSGEFFHQLHIYWCAKEAIYKQMGTKDILLSDILIHPFRTSNKGELRASIEKLNATASISYEVNKGFYLAHTKL